MLVLRRGLGRPGWLERQLGKILREYSNIPVIIGEYGSLDDNSAPDFYDDLETKQIPNLAWDFDPYSNCAPDLVEVDQSPSNLTPTDWGDIVKAYLAEHAP